MESINQNEYSLLLDKIFNMYNKIQHILLISLCDIFLKDSLNILQQDILVNDTIKLIKECNYNFDEICSNLNDNLERNEFIELSRELNEILNSNCIEIFEPNINIENIPEKNNKQNKKLKTTSKKSYEVDILSHYFNNLFKSEKVDCILEMGCGKSYLTEHILLKEEMIYIGIDKKDDLIVKTTKNIISENSFVIHNNVTVNNFPELFKTQISPIINKRENNKNILLFGLHSCGNLTSDTIKIFAENEEFSDIVIIGCCLNLLIEYVTLEAKNSEMFDYYIKNIGYDNKGNYLEQTFIYDYDFDKIGYPLSQHIITNYPNSFLGRTVRNSSMQNLPQNQDKIINSSTNIFYKKVFYRTILQSFMEIYLPEYKNYYGFGKIKLNTNDDFIEYLNQVFNNLFKKSNSNKNRIEEIKSYVNLNVEKINEEFLNELYKYEDLLWAVYIIRLKFSKIVEYLIALDRILFLQEKGIKNIKLIKIFDEKESVRNLLIYANKK